MRAAVGLALAAGLVACRDPTPPSAPRIVAACALGVRAQSPAGRLQPAEGWVQVPLAPCGGKAPAGRLRLVIEGLSGADAAFEPGRPGGRTLGVLRLSPAKGAAHDQAAFDVELRPPHDPSAPLVLVLAPADAGSRISAARAVLTAR